MSRVFRILAGLLVGATVAASLILLFAPQSGAETRRRIQESIEDILAEGRQAAEARRLELTAQFDELKLPRDQS
jgi:gas vesicle protein